MWVTCLARFEPCASEKNQHGVLWQHRGPGCLFHCPNQGEFSRHNDWISHFRQRMEETVGNLEAHGKSDHRQSPQAADFRPGPCPAVVQERGRLLLVPFLSLRVIHLFVTGVLRESVLFIGTQFRILYTCMHSPAGATSPCAWCL